MRVVFQLAESVCQATGHHNPKNGNDPRDEEINDAHQAARLIKFAEKNVRSEGHESVAAGYHSSSHKDEGARGKVHGKVSLHFGHLFRAVERCEDIALPKFERESNRVSQVIWRWMIGTFGFDRGRRAETNEEL